MITINHLDAYFYCAILPKIVEVPTSTKMSILRSFNDTPHLIFNEEDIKLFAVPVIPPTRKILVNYLKSKGFASKTIAQFLGMTEPNVSYHLSHPPTKISWVNLQFEVRLAQEQLKLAQVVPALNASEAEQRLQIIEQRERRQLIEKRKLHPRLRKYVTVEDLETGITSSFYKEVKIGHTETKPRKPRSTKAEAQRKRHIQAFRKHGPAIYD